MVMAVNFIFRAMTDVDASEIAGWRYDGPYSFYDMDRDPEDRRELLDPKSRGDAYFTAVDDSGMVAGFLSFRRTKAFVDVGLGLRPDLTGRGIGLSFVVAGLAFAEGRFGRECPLRLAVAAFNTRAIRVYEQAGFSIRSRFMQATNGGLYEFVEMRRD